jgi:hypothetical protein
MQNDKLLAVRNYSGDRIGYVAIDGRKCNMGFINDCYPEEDRLNVIFTPGGNIRAVVDIESGVELLTHYGDAYREKYIIRRGGV